MSKLKTLITLAGLAVAGAAIAQELKKPEAERTWNGKVADVIPYDFRVPTLERLKERMWNPEADSCLSPHVFGVGWTLNVGKIVADLKNATCCSAADADIDAAVEDSQP